MRTVAPMHVPLGTCILTSRALAFPKMLQKTPRIYKPLFHLLILRTSASPFQKQKSLQGHADTHHTPHNTPPPDEQGKAAFSDPQYLGPLKRDISLLSMKSWNYNEPARGAKKLMNKGTVANPSLYTLHCCKSVKYVNDTRLKFISWHFLVRFVRCLPGAGTCLLRTRRLTVGL